MVTKQHALVIGGSMAGMCAARVLANHFEKVTVADRDVYPQGALERSGVPQSRHVHVMLARGRRELERLFPGFEQTILSRGALDLDFGWDFAALRAGGWAPRQVYGIRLLHASRVLIEDATRDLLRKVPNVEFIEGVRINGLIADEDRSRVLGVKTISSEDRRTEGEIRADFIVDASGRSSKTPGWLEALGLPVPEEIVVDSHSAYASRWFDGPSPERRPKDWWWKGAWVDPRLPNEPYAGVLFPVENGRWVVTVAGLGKANHPPTDEQGFMATINNLRSPILAEALKYATPISDIYANRAMTNRWRRYDRWPAKLGGFIVIGDAACAFNPAYGQGMTTGALSALTLEDAISRSSLGDPQFPHRFFAAQAKVQEGPWGMATSADFIVPGCDGKRPAAGRILNPLVGLIMQRGINDPVIARTVGEVIHMLRPTADILAPRIVARALIGTVRHKLARRDEVAVSSAMPPASWGQLSPA